MKRLCYISHNYYKGGNKAKSDIEYFLAGMGAVNIGLKHTDINSKVISFFVNLVGILKACFLMKKDDTIVLQYPLKKYFSFVCHIAHLKGANPICVIHDLGSFRRKKLTIKQEIKRLSNSDYIIASNKAMASWLKEYGMKKPLGDLGLFDYLSGNEGTTKSMDSDSGTKKVVFAGGLSMKKTAFIVKLSECSLTSWHLDVYGNKDGLQGVHDNSQISFKGFVPSEEFVNHVTADFGLAWDGNSIDTCSGNFGEYLRWNSPHKVSFYLRSGLPVIVWKEAAVAPLLEQLGVGITIGSLEELNQKLASLSDEQLLSMKVKAKSIADKLNDGFFLQQAILRYQNQFKD